MIQLHDVVCSVCQLIKSQLVVYLQLPNPQSPIIIGLLIRDIHLNFFATVQTGFREEVKQLPASCTVHNRSLLCTSWNITAWQARD